MDADFQDSALEYLVFLVSKFPNLPAMLRCQMSLVALANL